MEISYVCICCILQWFYFFHIIVGKTDISKKKWKKLQNSICICRSWKKKPCKIFSEHCTTFKDKIHLGGLNLTKLVRWFVCTFFDKHSKVNFSEIQVRTWVQVVFRQKNRHLVGRPDRSANQRPVLLSGNNLNSCSDSYLRKNWL